MRYRKVEKKDVLAVIWRLLLFVAIEMVSAVCLAEKDLMIWWILILAGLVVWLVRWHCEYFGYECSKCGQKQQIDFLKEVFSINLINKKYLKCEKCEKWNKAKLMVVEK
jgi:DNA-directed RNA polymerase subunit RPC12/RpoP